MDPGSDFFKITRWKHPIHWFVAFNIHKIAAIIVQAIYVFLEIKLKGSHEIAPSSVTQHINNWTNEFLVPRPDAINYI